MIKQNKWFSRTFLKKISVGIILGGVIGFAYYYFVGCKSGNCAITSSYVNTTMYGALLGGLWTFPTKKNEKV